MDKNIFKKWLEENNNPKRDKCREIRKLFKDNPNLENFIFTINGVNTDIKKPEWIDDTSCIDINNYFSKDNFIQEKQIIENVEESKLKLINSFIQYIFKNHKIPTINDLNYKKFFSSIKELIEESLIINPDINKFILNENEFTKDYFNNVFNNIKQSKKFVITTAVVDKDVNHDFLATIENYISRNNAELLIIPCQDSFKRDSEYKWSLDYRLKKYKIIFDELYLNNNIYINPIKVSAKQINPLTGLDRIAQEKGSMIVASPKQFLKYVATSNTKLPKAMMTTGAITDPDYLNDLYMSDRLSRIAKHDHITGAIILEIEDEDSFYFRQIQADKNGSIVDLGTQYNSDGSICKVNDICVVLGDSHVGVHNLDVMEKQREIISNLDCGCVLLHDIFNATSITHHDIGRFAVRAIKSINNLSSLEEEAKKIVEYLKVIKTWSDKVVIVKSNHDESLDKYLDSGRFINDPINLYFSLDLLKTLIEGNDPLKFMINKFMNDENIIWLQRDEDYNVHGCECSNHGDLGLNGTKGTLVGMEKAYCKCVVGHSHTPAIYRSVYQVGTSSNLRLDYNKGASSWVHSLCLIYPNGARQMINIIKRNDNTYSWRI